MAANAIDPDGFEAKYREDPDPWDTWTSPFEAYKRRILLAACGPGRRGRVLELACGSGATTAALAKRALRLDAVDSSHSALATASQRCVKYENINFIRACLPAGMPRGPYDLIVVSELGYYMSPRKLDLLVDALGRALASNARLVMLHHHIPFKDAAQPPADIHERVRHRLGDRCVRYALGSRTARWSAMALAFHANTSHCTRITSEVRIVRRKAKGALWPIKCSASSG